MFTSMQALGLWGLTGFRRGSAGIAIDVGSRGQRKEFTFGISERYLEDRGFSSFTALMSASY